MNDFIEAIRKVGEMTPAEPAVLKIHPKALNALRVLIPEPSSPVSYRDQLFGIPIVACDWMPEDTGAIIDENGVHLIKFDIDETS